MWSCVASSVAGVLVVSSSSGAGPLPPPTSSQASWIPTFGRHPGVDGPVRSMAYHDDGSGPALFVGGQFYHAGSPTTANNVAKWDGSSWAPLRGLDSEVMALAVFDDGNGTALYAGGRFSDAFPTVVPRVAKWDGTTWSALGSGISSGGEQVNALVGFDDGSGPALYVGGRFTSAGGVSASSIAKWDGVSWSALGTGVNDEVLTLQVFDDGSGPALYAGGKFTSAGGTNASRIAKWDGTS